MASVLYIAPVLRVANLARSLAFYRDALGFSVEFVHESFYAGVRRGAGYIHLKRSQPNPRDQSAFETNEEIDANIGVTNIDALAKTYESAGVPFVIPLRQMPYGAEFYVRDPDGNILGFVEPVAAP